MLNKAIVCRSIRDKIVDLCSTPAIYETEVKAAESDYQRLRKENTNLVGITNVWNKVKEQVTHLLLKFHVLKVIS